MIVKPLESLRTWVVTGFSLGAVCLWAVSTSRGDEIAEDGAAPAAKSSAPDERSALTLDAFLAEVPPAERDARRWTFYERDLDTDGRLTAAERSNDDPAKTNPNVVEFRKSDLDHSGTLSSREFVEPAGPKFEAAAKQEFVTFDRDVDGQLTFAEFCETPRVNLDPAIRFRRLDVDRNELLSRDEFVRPICPLQRSARRILFYSFDATNDQQLNLEEYVKQGEGVVRSLRNKYLTRDADDDGRLSREEYWRPLVGSEWEKAAKEEAERFDLDGDGFLTLLEFAMSPQDQPHAEEVFPLLDADGDGLLSRAEFLQPRTPAQRLAERVQFYRFDADGDGRLSLDEFRKRGEGVASSLRSRYLSRDEDDDGRLSREEYWRPLVGSEWEKVAKEEADRFDLDGDGFLTLLEFAMSPQDQPYAEEVFRLLDADGDESLTRAEFLKPRPKDQWASERSRFYRYDGDADGRLSRDEYFKQGKGVVRSVRSEYLGRDADDDRMSCEEYWRPSIGTQWEQIAKDEAARHDLDGDGFLTFLEFSMTPQAQPLTAEVFPLLDVDGDKYLTQAEFLRPRPKEQRPSAGGQFYRLDRNADGKLNLDEFRQSGEPDQFRPDPIVVATEKVLDTLEAACATVAQGPEGSLTAQQWPQRVLEKNVVDLPILPFNVWDRNHDGRVTAGERRLVLDIAFGIRREDETLMRKPGGYVFGAAYFRGLDKNRDDRISREEFLSGHHEGAKNGERFGVWDTNGDGELTFPELALLPQLFSDVLWEFCNFDSNMDGRLTTAELVAGAKPWQTKMAPRLVAAFDRNADAALDVDEYQRTPFAQHGADWYLPKADKDFDGRLSWAEFYNETPPSLAGVSWSFFRAFDRDGDGTLSPLEFDFSVDLERAPAEVVVIVLDKNRDGVVQVSDLLDGERPPATDPVKRLRWEERAIRVEDVFRTADRDGNGSLTAEELKVQQGPVTAAVLGKAIPQPPRRPAGGATPSPTSTQPTESWSWRFLGLVACNILLLAGAAWFVLRPASQADQS